MILKFEIISTAIVLTINQTSSSFGNVSIRNKITVINNSRPNKIISVHSKLLYLKTKYIKTLCCSNNNGYSIYDNNEYPKQ